jgi:hypothetical protein
MSYVATCRAAVANPRTIGKVGHDGSATYRGFLEHFIVSVGGTPADNSIIFTLQRCTTAGTFTSVTPANTETADGAPDLIAGENATAEPTYTASTELFDNDLNQRAIFMLVYTDQRWPVIPATANNGIGMKATHASVTASASVTFQWLE